MSTEDKTQPSDERPGPRASDRTDAPPPAPGTAAPTPQQPGSDVLPAEELGANPTVKVPSREPGHRGGASPDLAEHCRALFPQAPRVPGCYPMRKLGQGTFGQVWLFQEQHSGRRLAIKFLTRRASEEWLLLQAEVKQLALLDGDPGIVQLRDVEPAADPPYYVMTYAEGGSLADRLKRGPLPVAEALRIGTEVARALAYVHAKGVRHCDLKPGNILLDARGRALVGDFGQAHLASDLSSALGTFFYMAPEQADLKETIPDTRWDVYGLGALLYAMLTGQPPRSDPDIRDRLANAAGLSQRLELYRACLQAAPPPCAHRHVKGVDRHLAAIIDRCLEIDPAKRLHDAGAVLAELERRQRILRNRPVLLFGLLAPLFLLLVLAGVGRLALTHGLERSESALVEQLQQSDLATARLVANVVEDELDDRRLQLERKAGQKQLRAALHRRDGNELTRLLESYHDELADRKLFEGWVLVDAEGELLAHYPPANPSMSNFRFRDWFHGGGDRFDNPRHPFTPIRATHISQPYVGKLHRDALIAVSTPVFAPDDERRAGPPIGVLMARLPLEDLYRWLSPVQIDNGFAVLVSDRSHCLRHRLVEHVAPEAGRNPRSYEECAVFREVLAGNSGSDTYTDPLDGQEYLVSYAPFLDWADKGLPCWGALVQHNRDAALKPVRDLRDRMHLLGLVTLGVSALLTFALWGWLIVTLRREESPAPG